MRPFSSSASCARRFPVPFIFVATLVCPAPLLGQGGARDAMATFPAQAQQILYTNLAQLRTLPNYAAIRPWVITQQLSSFEGIVRSLHTDPETDIDEVTLGWPGAMNANPVSFGLAEGQFHPEIAHDFFVQHQTPYQQYEGYEVYGFGSSSEPDALHFAFLDSSTAIFGRLADVKAMLDVRAGKSPPLQSNSGFVKAADELEGSAAQWGIIEGAMASRQALPLLGGDTKPPGDPKTLVDPIRSILYHLDWDTQLALSLSIVCQEREERGRAEPGIVTFARRSASVERRFDFAHWRGFRHPPPGHGCPDQRFPHRDERPHSQRGCRASASQWRLAPCPLKRR